jgi:hypothetical protein
VPPADAPKVELAPSLEQDAAFAASFPPPEPNKKKRRAPAASTYLMPDVQKRREEQRKEKSDKPLVITLGVLGLIIVGLVIAIAYGLRRAGVF